MELTAKQAREMRREENRRAWARRQDRFDREAERHQREGASQDGYTVEKATLSGVTVRHESGARCTLAPKLDRGRAYVTLHSRSRFARRLYADEMA